ncbi:hypothetical protein ACFW1A_01850 [Kitasatospora sp. NPDC058965]|uniref:hypothetical protein n=1 Tax=Kitasatospora sp. NPDC058965 TaxID=3346682 RepID=UPI00368C254C
MADNETPIALPAQSDELEGLVTGAVQATGQAADQHIEPDVPAEQAVPAVATPAETARPVPSPGTPGPLGDVINTQ